MSGNVWEWVADWHSKNYSQNSSYRNQKGPEIGKFKVQRGGSWSKLLDISLQAIEWFMVPQERTNSMVSGACNQIEMDLSQLV